MQTSISHAGNAKYKHFFKRNIEVKEQLYKKEVDYLNKIKAMQNVKNDRYFIDDILEIAEDFKAVDYQDIHQDMICNEL